MRKKIINAFLWSLLPFILLSSAFINKFPLVTSDTGTYISSGFENTVPYDRPITYGLFVRHISLVYSLWLVILAQAIILTYLLVKTIRFVVKDISKTEIFIVFILLCYCSGISWYCCQIMPDIFTAIACLSLLLLLIGELKRTETVIISIIFLFSVITHSSNILSFTTGFAFLVAINHAMRKITHNLIPLKRLVLCGILVLVPWLLLPSIQYAIGGKFAINQGSHVFLMGRLSENGILHEYLNKECGEKNYKICQYKDSLPASAISFVWNPQSPLYKTGGWEQNKKEYDEIIKGTLTNYHFLWRNIVEAFKAGLKQLMQNDVGDGINQSMQEGSTPYGQISRHFRKELGEYNSSCQNQLQLNFDSLNTRQNLAFIISLILILFFIARDINKTKEHTLLAIFTIGIFCFIISNAFVTGALANVLARLQGRISWLIIFDALVLLSIRKKEIVNTFKSINPS